MLAVLGRLNVISGLIERIARRLIRDRVVCLREAEVALLARISRVACQRGLKAEPLGSRLITLLVSVLVLIIVGLRVSIAVIVCLSGAKRKKNSQSIIHRRKAK